MLNCKLEVAVKELAKGALSKELDLEPDYQREDVWAPAKQKLLIDSLLRDYVVPSLYFRKNENGTTEVLDGKQRVRAIWDFYNTGLKLVGSNFHMVDGQVIQGAGYRDLPLSLQRKLDNTRLTIIQLSDADDDEVAEMFSRLQNGVTLNAQEKRNAMSGALRDYIRHMGKHSVFERINFPSLRFAHQHVAAQCLMVTINNFEGSLKNTQIDDMYKAYNANFNEIRDSIALFETYFTIMSEVFAIMPDTIERKNIQLPFKIERHDFHAFYIMLHKAMKKNLIVDPIALADWYTHFLGFRKSQNPESPAEGWEIYFLHIAGSTDTAESLRNRTDFMLKHYEVFCSKLSR